MAGVLYIRDPETGEFSPVPVLVGPKGAPGPGVPAGGSAGQVLVKSGEADYETQWRTLTADDVGARASDWMPTADDVGAISNMATTANLTKISTYLDYGGGNVTRIGKFVFLFFTCSTKAAIPNGGEIFTVPEGFRPNQDLNTSCGGTDKTSNPMRITRNGSINSSGGSDISAGIWISYFTMYIGE